MLPETNQVVQYRWHHKYKMIDLINIINSGNGAIRLEVTADDLASYSKQLITDVIAQMGGRKQEEEESLLPKKDVIKLFGVTNGTLHNWAKSRYLVPVKIGRSVFYRDSDIKRMQGKRKKEGGQL